MMGYNLTRAMSDGADARHRQERCSICNQEGCAHVYMLVSGWYDRSVARRVMYWYHYRLCVKCGWFKVRRIGKWVTRYYARVDL